ncbi:MAG: TetR/AcrR family transcriptional regulator [Gemmatimonadaceae bacterium]
MTAAPVADAKVPAVRRILDAARGLVARGGAAGISMGDVAASAGVSKALVHYHFHDKESLLRELADRAGRDVIKRERDAMARESDAAPHALDAYWTWLREELARGDVNILLALGEYDSARVRDACRRASRERLSVAEEHVSLVFGRLGLTPRVPAGLVAQTTVAFIDGLAAGHALAPDRDPRPAFDVLWLGLLTLAG